MTGSGTTPVAAQSSQIEAIPTTIRTLLSDRASAWKSHDAGLLAKTMERGGYADAQLKSLANAKDIDFVVYDFHATTSTSGDIASNRVRRQYKGMEVRAYQVVEGSQIAGIESQPYVENSFMTFVRKQADTADPYEGWRTASESDFEVLGLYSTVRLWDEAPVEVATSAHFALLSHPDIRDKVANVLGQAEKGYAAATKFWPRRIDSKFVIIVASTGAELGRIIHATVDLSKFVAFAAGSLQDADGYVPAGARVYLQLSRFDAYEELQRVEILAHELIHAITRPVAGPFIPTWVEEGLANLGADGRVGAIRKGPSPGDFPPDDNFFVGPTSDIVRTYARSQLAIQVLDAKFGREATARFYESLGAARIVPGTSAYHVDQSINSVGWSKQAWLEAWRSKL